MQGTQQTLETTIGKKLKVQVPAGVDTGTRLRLKGEGAAGQHQGAAGDLYIVIAVRNHPLYIRDDKDLYCTLMISDVDAARGTRVTVPTIGARKPLSFDVPAGTASGTRFLLRGHGVADPLDPTKVGNLYATVEVR